jgi:HTH-type transcriptional regulator/antitoxin HigA
MRRDIRNSSARLLLEEYEDRIHPLPKTKPHRMLAYLLEEKHLKPGDLWRILPKSRVSEILGGKRGISRSQAKQLAELFRVPVEIFLWTGICPARYNSRS